MASLRQCIASSLLALAALPHWAHAALTDLYLVTGKGYCREGYQKIKTADSLTGDLNQGFDIWFYEHCSAKQIFLCVKYGYEGETAITDIQLIPIVVPYHQVDCSDLGDSWTPVGQEEGSNGNCDQLECSYAYGDSHPLLLLCYTTSSGQPAFADVALYPFGDCSAGWAAILHKPPLSGSLNDYGTDIYMCHQRECVAKTVTGEWIIHGTISAPMTEQWKHGTVKTVSETQKEESWSQSVTAKVSAGFDFKGVSGKAEISPEFSHTFAQSYSEEWSVSEEHDFSVTWGPELVGKTTWQFVFDVWDTCHNPVRTKLMECSYGRRLASPVLLAVLWHRHFYFRIS